MTSAFYNCEVLALNGARVRPTPTTSNDPSGTFAFGTKFDISGKVADSNDPTNIYKVWGHIFGGPYDGLYTALEYPGNQNPISSSTSVVTPPPGDPSDIKVILSSTIRYIGTDNLPHEVVLFPEGVIPA